MLTSRPSGVRTMSVRIVRADCLSDVVLNDNETVIGIEEGHMFHDLCDISDQWANQGRSVYVSALSGTYQRRPFSNVACLIARAEMTVHLRAVCMKCRKSAASFTKLTASDSLVTQNIFGQPHLVGGAESYMSVCRSCYFSK